MDKHTKKHKLESRNKVMNMFETHPKTLTTLQQHSKTVFSAGALTCAAFGTLFLGSSFQSTPSKEVADLVSYVSTQQPNTNKNTYPISEIEQLKQQLQITMRELDEYKAQLFRSSHPMDQAKISELGHLLAEKEKLNQQLSTALQALEKELHLARKQATALESTTETLGSMLQSHKDALNARETSQTNQLAELQNAFETEKKQLVSKINGYEESQLKLLAVLENKHASVNSLKSALSQQNQFAETLVNELHELSTIYTNALHTHQTALDQQAMTFYEELQASQLYALALQEKIDTLQQHLAQSVKKEKDASQRLNTQINTAKQIADLHSQEIAELKQAQTNSMLAASLLTHQLDEIHQIYKAQIQDKQQDYLDMEVSLQLALHEVTILKRDLIEAQAARNKNAKELAAVESLLDDLKEQVRMSLVQYSLALESGENLNAQLTKAQSALKEKEENLASLEAFVQELTEDKLFLQKENNWLTTQHEVDQKTLTQHKMQRKELDNRVVDAEETFAAAFAKYDSTIKKLEEELRSYKDQLAKAESQNHSYHPSNLAKDQSEDPSITELLVGEIAARDTALAHTKLELKILEEANNALHAKHQQEMEQLIALQQDQRNQIDKLHGEISSLSEKHHSYDSKNMNLQTHTKALITELDEIKYALKQAKENESHFTHLSNNLEKRLQESEDRELALSQEMLRLQAIIADKDNAHNMTRKTLANLEKEYNHLEEHQSEEKKSRLTNELERLSDLLGNKDENFSQLEDEVTNANQQHELLHNRLTQMKRQIAEAQQAGAKKG